MVALAVLSIGLCAVRWPSFGPIWVEGAWLLPPLAAWLAARFGRAGAIAATGSAALLAVPAISFDPVSLGGIPAYALLAIFCAWAVERRAGLAAIAQLPRPHRAWTAVPVLLPLFAAFALLHEDGLRLALNWSALALLAPLLLVGGLRGVSARDAAIGVGAAVVLGVALTLATPGRVEGEAWRIGYGAIQPALWLLAAAAWWLGHALRRAARGETPPLSSRAAWIAILAMFLLSLDPGQFALRLPPLTLSGVRLFYGGALAALPLAAFAAGALVGLRGAWTVSALALLPSLVGLALLVASDGEARVTIGNVLAAPTALAWGWLGAHLAGRAGDVPRLRIAGGAVIAFALAFLALVDQEAVVQLALGALAALAAVLLATLVARLRARTGVTGEGWIPVAMLPLYASVVLMSVPMLEGIGGALRRSMRVPAWPLDEALMQVVLLAVPLIATAFVLREVVRGVAWLPKILRDLRALARLVYQPAA